jgi:hypothetical protein
MYSGGEYAQLPPVSRLGQGDVSNVVFQVEIGVFYPVWSAQAPGDRSQFTSKYGGEVYAAFQHLKNLFESNDTSLGCVLIINTNATDVLW